MASKGDCLQCGRPYGNSELKDFCSVRCEASHRQKILGRLSELSNGDDECTDSWRAGLFSLAQTTSDLRYSAAEAEVERTGPIPRGRLITLLPAQGGSGASTTALHVAEAIARNPEEEVLLIDYDFHSGTTAFRLGLQPRGSLDELLSGGPITGGRLKQAATSWGRLSVLTPAAERSQVPLRLSRLDDVIRAAMESYSTVVVDHPDALYSASRAVLSNSSFV